MDKVQIKEAIVRNYCVQTSIFMKITCQLTAHTVWEPLTCIDENREELNLCVNWHNENKWLYCVRHLFRNDSGSYHRRRHILPGLRCVMWTKLFSASSVLVDMHNWTCSDIFIDSNLQDMLSSLMKQLHIWILILCGFQQVPNTTGLTLSEWGKKLFSF